MIDESENGNIESSLEKKLINKHTGANGGLIREQLPLQYIFGFCRTFKKTMGLGFELELRTSDRKQDTLYTLLRVNTHDVIFDSINLSEPPLNSNPETRRHFNEAFTKTFTLFYDS